MNVKITTKSILLWLFLKKKLFCLVWISGNFYLTKSAAEADAGKQQREGRAQCSSLLSLRRRKIHQNSKP